MPRSADTRICISTDGKPPLPWTTLPRWLRVLISVWFWAGGIPIGAEAFGYHFLPSPDWVSRTYVLATLSGIAMMSFGTWLIVTTLAMDKPKKPGWKRGLHVGAAILFGFFFGSTVVTSTIPILTATLAGDTTQIEFVVTTFERSNDSNCRNPVTLDGMPWLLDKLCDFPEELHDRIAFGERIGVTGRGTALGLFPQSVSTFDE